MLILLLTAITLLLLVVAVREKQNKLDELERRINEILSQLEGGDNDRESTD